MTESLSLSDSSFGYPQGLIRKSHDPRDSGSISARAHRLIELESNGVRSVVAGDEMTERPLDVLPPLVILPQEMERGSDQPLPHERSNMIFLFGGQIGKL